MKIRHKFLRTNLTLFAVGLDIFYIIIFFVFYLIKLKLELTLVSSLQAIADQPVLILMIIHPLLLWLVLKLNVADNISYQDELEKDLNKQNKKVNEVYKFVEILRNGGKYQFSPEFQQDKLVRSMLNLRDELEEARKEEEQRAKEEQHRHWINEGLAKFGAILRENVDNLEKLASEVTSNLSRYMNAQQAGFFIINEEEGEKYIDMLALFAFDRKKFPDKRFMWGEGLIGSCAIERKTIFLKETTDSFVDITSGLGNANPRSILIVPIKDNDDRVHGVLEIASFKVFEDYEINFVEQLAESIGLTIASIKTNVRTQELLKESQQQAEMLAQQEAEMRQKIKETEKRSEDAVNKLKSLDKELNALSNNVAMLKIAANGVITSANKIFYQYLNQPIEKKLADTELENLISANDRFIFNSTFEKILSNKKPESIALKFITNDNKFILLNCFFSPIIDENNNIEAISLLAFESTEQLNELLDLQTTTLAIDELSILIEINDKGQIIQANDKFAEVSNYDPEKIIDEKFEILFPEDKKEMANTILLNTKRDGKYKIITKLLSKNKEEFIIEAVCAAIQDINNEVKKYKFIANDITEEVKAIEKYHQIEQQLQKTQREVDRLSKNTEAKINQEKKKLTEEFKQSQNKAFILNNLLNNLEKAVIIFENDSIVLFNSYAEKLLGFKAEITMGKKPQYIFPADDKLAKEKNYIGNLIGQKFLKQELFLVDKNQRKHNIIADSLIYSIENKEYKALIIEEKA